MDAEESLTNLRYLPDCSTTEMLQVLDGQLQLVHNNYAPNSSLTVGNLTVKAWKDRLETELAKRVNASKQAGANRSIRHQSFNINAVWAGIGLWHLKPLDR